MTEAQKLIQIITETAESVLGQPVQTGGCRPFYGPEEWRARGETYGRGAALIVTHDGGEYADFFDAYYAHPHSSAMDAALAEAGYFAEGIYSWATAIYPL
jgi:hypothetical protein